MNQWKQAIRTTAELTFGLRKFIPSISVWCLLASLVGVAPCRTMAEPVSVIFDTDMGGDCDDVGALFMLHGAVERGEAKLLATMGCISTQAIAPCLDAINTWFGRPEIPVGTLKDPGLLDGHGYPEEIVQHFPHRFPNSKDYPDALAVYRQVLTAQADGSVIIVAVGPLRNMANLLKSDRALIAQKVKLLHVMGGHYPPEANRKEAEYNFMKDATTAALVSAQWPTPILFNGEGGSTNSGRRVTYEMPEHNPLTMAYAAYPGVGYAGDRLSWDPVSCLVAVRGAAPWYEIVSSGRNVVDAGTGLNTWAAGGPQGHSYLVLKKGAKATVETALEDLMVAGRGRPAQLNFNTAYYAQAGLCRSTASGAAEPTLGASNAFDQDDKSAWLDRSSSSWIQYQYADGRKSRVTSYTLVCPDPACLPRRLELLGSNDDGRTWTRLDLQETPGFKASLLRREFSFPRSEKYNLYRLRITAVDETSGVKVATLALNETINCRPGIAVASLVLDHADLRLTANSRATLNASLTPLDTFECEVTWTSSDPTVATVGRIGEQTAVVASKKPGTCMITATSGKGQQTCAVTVTPTSLPAAWSYDELSAPPIPGSVAVANDHFTLTGCGHAMTGFWERVRDQGVYVSQAAPGDATISACLTSLAPNVGGPAYKWDSRPSTAAGLMLRESLTEGCGRYALIQVEATGKLVFRWRDKIGPDESHAKDLGPATLPLQLKLTRRGQEIQIFRSTDGQHWGEPLVTHPTAFSGPGRLGLFTCSGNTFASTTAEFTSVKVTP